MTAFVVEGRTRRQKRLVAAVSIGVALAVVGYIVGWYVWSVHTTWRQLDEAVAEFDIPPGFTEVERVRGGTALCFVTCTRRGGEAVVTVVLDPGSLSVRAACEAMEKAVGDFLDDAGTELEPTLGLSLYECDFGGPLDGVMRIRGSVEQATDLSKGSGTRWLDDVDVPDLPVVAWVEFNSGIE